MNNLVGKKIVGKILFLIALLACLLLLSFGTVFAYTSSLSAKASFTQNQLTLSCTISNGSNNIFSSAGEATAGTLDVTPIASDTLKIAGAKSEYTFSSNSVSFTTTSGTLSLQGVSIYGVDITDNTQFVSSSFASSTLTVTFTDDAGLENTDEIVFIIQVA